MRKMDEMELKLSEKSTKITWFITVMVMYIIGFIQKYQAGGGNIFLTIATSSVVLNLLLNQYYLSKIDKNRSFIKLISSIILLSAIILLLIWLLSK